MNIGLRQGDVLVYRPTGVLGWAIATKTFHNWAHVEMVWVPLHTSAAARAEGVNLYPMRWEQLGRVLRPPDGFDVDQAVRYFATVRGQAYDWPGLFAYLRLGKGKGNKQYCSELATNLMRAGWHADWPDLFNGEDSRLIPPYYFPCLAGQLRVIWTDGKP